MASARAAQNVSGPLRDIGDAVEEMAATDSMIATEALLGRVLASPAVEGPSVIEGAAGDLHGKGSRVVLLVEDEAPVRAFASRALRLRGYDVREADSAEAALEQLRDKALNVDLFVTDVIMPGLDGPTWVREAMKARPDVRTIFISGYTQDAMSETSVPVPNSVFLPKPFSLADLTRTVERALA